MRQLQSGRNAAALSLQARLILSRLAADQGFRLEPVHWTNRGSGQPLHPRMPAGWYASISHRHDRFVVALASCPVGIDLEIWQKRHMPRVQELVQLLPEAAIRRRIRRAADPQRSFYKVYTLHEAMYKLATARAQPVQGLFDTRVEDLRPRSGLSGWQWEDAEWMLSIVTANGRTNIELPLGLNEPACHEIELSTAAGPCRLYEEMSTPPAIRSLRV